MIKTGKRMALYSLVLMAICFATAGTAFVLKLHVDNARQQAMALPLIAAPGKGHRVMIFAPHCDDETLGTGGLIAQSLASGAEVRVVLMTNGDGFTVAAAKSLHHIRLSADDYVQFAMRRQRETLKALSVLGLPAKNVTFLGYPDRGLAPMWCQYWTNTELYRSHYTGRTHSPYPNAFQKNAPYYGINVLHNVEQVISDFRPTDVFMPHPNDDHSDHWGTNCYVNAALNLLRERGEISEPIRVRTYLVHRGDWPVPQGQHLDSRLVPPSPLRSVDTRWKSMMLTPSIVKTKRQAILRYTTQTAVMRRFLLSFAREDELFGELPTETVPDPVKEQFRVDGRIDDWRGIQPIIKDPTMDNLSRRMEGGGDIRAVYVAQKGDELFVRLDMRRQPSPRVFYRIRMHLITPTAPEPEELSIEFFARKDRTPAGPVDQIAWGGHSVEVSTRVPALYKADALYISADTRVGRIGLDRSAWHLLTFVPRSSH